MSQEPSQHDNPGSNGQRWAEKRIFTTGEAAEVCKVSQQTIIRCFDTGRLQGFRVPGSKFRRIPREELLRFMKDNDIPTDALESGKKRVLLVGDNSSNVELLIDILGRDGRFDVQTAQSGYDAGLLTMSFRPHVMILDCALPDVNGTTVCRRVRENPATSHIKIIFVSGIANRQEIDALLKAGADEFLQRPFDVEKLLKRVADLSGLSREAA